ncbi:MAG: preprotein translocase subunit SecA [Chloroflexi bacterium]|nr:preprotein translocase subunit SecA [Chloroflexota bacterium]
MSLVGRIGGLFDSNEGELRKLRKLVTRVNEREPEMSALSDDDLRQRTAIFRERLAKGEAPDDLLCEAFAAVREASQRTNKQRHFDVQLIGGMALHNGHIAEMKTGEGKTLVASLALYLNALEGKGAHLVTTNDYLAKTGAGWMAPIYHALGMSVAYIAHDKSAIHDPSVELDAVDWRHRHWRDITRKEAYLADITYGQNSEFGFDYLRDNMVVQLTDMVQRPLHYAIVDEADSILIDEARTPLIISAPAEDATDTYYRVARTAARLVEGTDYVIEEKHRAVTLTESGIDKAERLLNVRDLYTGDADAIHYLDNAVKARALYKRDKDYIVKDGEVVIIDEFTGRQMPGRRWSDGLHQAVEAKENVKIQRETRTFATITIQNYFRMYTKLAGMTGTAATEAEELFKVYKLEVTVIPTHRPMVRRDDPDLVYKSEQGKWAAIIADVQSRHQKGQPILIGTTSVEKSQRLSDEMDRHGLDHEVLNAKNHEREALIIAKAGQQGGITVSTNMAGRGVDILLGDGVVALGGLHVIGTERHEARRIDNQLRGRAGRQGDPGSSRFFVSLEDDLIRVFASERVAALMDRLGFDDSQPIESKMVTGAITQAQIKVEARNFDIRKRALEFDDVLNEQRRVIYGQRRKILEQGEVKETLLEFLHDEAAALAEAAASIDPEERDIEQLRAALGALIGREIPAAELEDAGNDLLGRVAEIVDEAYDDKERELGEELMREVERLVLLRAIDTHWVEHLTQMEELREGIYLRGYGQQDPLIAYKKEAHRYWEEMNARLATTAAQMILRVSVRRVDETEQQREQERVTRAAQGTASGGGLERVPSRPPVAAMAGGSHGAAPAKGKLGRNDPCYCGSGKKYKKCHGR